MAEPEYVTRPTLDPGPPQWTYADLVLARGQGRNQDIADAQDRGQLRDLLAQGTGIPHSAAGKVGTARDIKSIIGKETH